MKSIIEKVIVYAIAARLICPIPNTIYLKDSMIDVIGFNKMAHLYFSGTMDNGKITGEAYINKRTIKLMINRISLYFEVMAENNRPKPSPRVPIRTINKGRSQITLY